MPSCHYGKNIEAMQDDTNIDVIYLDFAIAFDKVDIGVTLQKNKINEKLGRWQHFFLTDRTQTMLMNDAKSQPCLVKSGVSQESILGQALFLMLIGDIDQAISNDYFVSSIADDTRVDHPVKT